MEGIEGSGKSTQAGMLSTWLSQRGYSVILRKEPTTDAPIGKIVHDVLKKNIRVADEAIPLLFAADRADDTRRFIGPALDKGAIVVVDRYTYSSLAYQSGGMAVPFDIRWLRDINKYALSPDIVFYLDVEPEAGLKRVTGFRRLQDDTYFEDVKALKRIREAYYQVLGLNKPSSLIRKLKTNGIPGSILDSVKISTIESRTLVIGLDGTEPMDRVHEQIRTFVDWLVTHRRGSVKRERSPSRGVAPLSQFTVSRHREQT
jgi:dTMP kinase